jgi:integrase
MVASSGQPRLLVKRETRIRLEQAQERLRAGSWWHQTGYVFTTSSGEPYEPRNALRAFKAAAKRAGLPTSVGLHTLRHTAASVMLENGVPLKIVSEILGHASVAITGDIYATWLPTFRVRLWPS